MDVKTFNTVEGGEIEVIAGEVIIDNGIDTAVQISLLTDKNWWADSEIGSELYKEKKNSPESRLRISQYIKDCLQWLIDENVAYNITVELTDILQNGVVYVIIISQPDKVVRYKYYENWQEQKRNVERTN